MESENVYKNSPLMDQRQYEEPLTDIEKKMAKVGFLKRELKEAMGKLDDFSKAGKETYSIDKNPASVGLNKFKPEENQCPPLVAATTFFTLFLLVLYGKMQDFFGKIFFPSEFKHLKINNGYAPLNSDFEDLFSRRLYRRIRDCWHRFITGVPGRHLNLLERYSKDGNATYKYTGRALKMLNLSSYNYLGFAEKEGLCCTEVIECIKKYGVGIGSTRGDTGNIDLHREVEKMVARFVGKDDAIIFSMGFATNALMIRSIVERGCLIISDVLNHTSLVFGSRFSGATIQKCQHNDMEDLERVLRKAISRGQPRTFRPWRKIIVIVEGLYSMEGSIVKLPELIELKKKYKFNLFVDEAHSVGALGSRGRGVCDFFGIDPKEVDILMGTFTKSFGAAGGYIAGDSKLIQHLKNTGFGHLYTEPMSPPVCQQVLTSMGIIMGEKGHGEGVERIKRIKDNSIYFMRELRKMGFIVFGDEGSPIVPLMLFQPGKISRFSHECLARNMAVVVVGYPATPIHESRVRFCISAGHTKSDLDEALEHISEIGDVMQLKYKKKKSYLWIFSRY